MGENIQITVPEDSKLPLESFAAQYQMGLSNMLEANPGVDPFLPKAGSTLTIPQQLILQDAPREGIIINSAEMRLYYYLRVTVSLFLSAPESLQRDTPNNWALTAGGVVVLISAALVLLLGVYPQPLISLVQMAQPTF